MPEPESPRRSHRRAATIAVSLMACALAYPALALAHVERASYWPDPRPDHHVHPAAGGKVPKYRPLRTALLKAPPGRTRVVCRARSMKRLRGAIHRAHRKGYKLRPMGRRYSLSKHKAHRLLRINRRLRNRCHFHSIQKAVTASHNNDRVVVMPGLYREPKSRSAPTDDPKCADLKEENDKGDTGAVSYAYQAKCPNDQNLIAVIGRAVKGRPPQPPLDDRHGIPDEGRCIRCNLQIEGSGPTPDDVVIDAGRVASGDHGPIGAKKDVGLRVDRADGFVVRNLKIRHAAEHGIYLIEVDGYLADRIKLHYNGEYGHLSFVADHGLLERCDATGSGDAGLYPGASADTGAQRVEGPPRHSQEIRFCDSHHNAQGYSGTDGNAVHVDHNNFYDNAEGFTTDVVTAPGHPGFPQDSDLIEHNRFFSNNFNPYLPGSDVEPDIGLPVGTGLNIAGGNDNIIRHNHFYDNWRRGAMVIGVPDSIVCTPPDHQAGCDPTKVSTSYNNKFHDNVMGIAPGGASKPNGVDFWWDQFPGNTGNCWYDNGDVTSDPPAPLLPDCKTVPSIGTGNPPHEAELLSCFVAFSSGGYDPNSPSCDWFRTPPKPGSKAAEKWQARSGARATARDPGLLRKVCRLYGSAASDVRDCPRTRG